MYCLQLGERLGLEGQIHMKLKRRKYQKLRYILVFKKS